MNKVELVAKVAENLGFTKKDVTAVVEAMVDVVKETVASGEDVKVAGLGTFTIVERAEREGRNPATGETMTIPASKSPKFKAAKAFKDAVKGE